MTTKSPTTKPSDLIAIANPKLAEKLAEEKKTKKSVAKSNSISTEEKSPSHANTGREPAHKTYRQEVWKAVFTLNLFRYIFALLLILTVGIAEIYPKYSPFNALFHPKLVYYCCVVLLVSATAFTAFTRKRSVPLRIILSAQFFIDTITAGLIVHATGSIASSFTMLFLIITLTGSVVLPRKEALALACGSILVIYFEHFFSVISSHQSLNWRFDALAMYGILLMFLALAISSLARMVRHAEISSYHLGAESIDDYLIREEIQALKSALEATEGNKTEAAKLLGMTFRSFRYKLSKHRIS